MSEGNFEAKVSAKRETSAGIFLTLQIQPDDYKSELATLRVGSALMMGWAEVVNTAVEPIEIPSPQAAGGHARAAALPPGRRAEIASAAGNARWDKERKPFASLPLSQQAALRCSDPSFRKFLARNDSQYLMYDTDLAADAVREFCKVNSRRDLDDERNDASRDLWAQLDAQYLSWSTDIKYADVRR